jgi:hypothetical protein
MDKPATYQEKKWAEVPGAKALCEWHSKCTHNMAGTCEWRIWQAAEYIGEASSSQWLLEDV